MESGIDSRQCGISTSGLGGKSGWQSELKAQTEMLMQFCSKLWATGVTPFTVWWPKGWLTGSTHATSSVATSSVATSQLA